MKNPSATGLCLASEAMTFALQLNLVSNVGAIESLAGQPKFAAAIIRARGVSALVGLLNAGSLEAFLPTMRALRELSGEALWPY